MGIIFEWDAKKATANQRKHGVAFTEAETVFSDPLSLTIPDPVHSTEEDRFVTIGASMRGRVLVIVHTDRGEHIRIISARRANRRERRSYEGSA